ncbi:MAG TPA: ACT domain-containing protein [Candidatus Limnocylindria bacterium]|nr:ACT domain-containing protein [Candidatus Limnocylindria bacterium]
MTDDTQHTFELTVDAVPGAIERVLSVVRRRGLGLRSFRADAGDGGRWVVRIRAGAAPTEAALALRQFTSLIDVRTACLGERDHPAS